MARRPDDPWWRRHLAELVVLAVGFLVVTGLWLANRGGADGDSVDAASTTTTVTAVPSTAEGEPAPDPTAEETPAVTGEAGRGDADRPAPLGEAVLRRADLPAGWSELAISGDPAPLCAGQDPLASARPSSTARALFTRGSEARQLGGTVAAFSTREGASGLLRAVRDAAAACARQEGSYEVVTLAKVGDESLGVAFEVPYGSSVVRGVVYLARVGSRAAVITATATGAEVDRELALRGLRAQAARL